MTPVRIPRLIVALATASLLASCAARPTAAPAPASGTPIEDVPLAAVGTSGASGTAHLLSTAKGAVTLTLEMRGLRAGAKYNAWLHAGSCAQPSASAGHLGALTGDARGTASLKTTNVHAGATGTLVDLTRDLLGDGDHLLLVSDTDGTAVACGQLPKATT